MTRGPGVGGGCCWGQVRWLMPEMGVMVRSGQVAHGF